MTLKRLLQPIRERARSL